MLKPLLVVAAVMLPTAIAAQPVSVPVNFADLNLNAAAGRSALDRRITMTVRSICGRPATDLMALRAHRACVVEAMASAAPQKAVALARAQRGVQVAQAN